MTGTPACELACRAGYRAHRRPRHPVLPAVREVLPQRTLVRGSIVSVAAGTGATSLAFALVAEATQQGHWVAFVGLPPQFADIRR
jgi:hypothetical protein